MSCALLLLRSVLLLLSNLTYLLRLATTENALQNQYLSPFHARHFVWTRILSCFIANDLNRRRKQNEFPCALLLLFYFFACAWLLTYLHTLHALVVGFSKNRWGRTFHGRPHALIGAEIGIPEEAHCGAAQ